LISAVIPAKAGVQCLKRFFKDSFTAWVPVFTGMTD